MKRPIAAAAVAAGALLLGVTAPAAARPAADPRPVVTDLVSPLSIGIDIDGTMYVTQDFAGILTKVDRRGNRTDLVTKPGEEIAAASALFGKVTYANSTMDGAKAEIRQIDRRGNDRLLVDLAPWEAANNPDADVTYGFLDLAGAAGEQCAAELAAIGIPPTHPGEVYSHPYATSTLPTGGAYVADAGGNSLLHVSPRGHVSVVAVLPPIDIVVDEATAAGFGIPSCAGFTYRAEPVPTDVEVGLDGMLYVTSLPGVPEGPNGRVLKVNPWNGKVTELAGGINGATDLAVTPSGDVYVAELTGGRLLRLARGSAELQTHLELPGAASVEWHAGKLYVGTLESFETGAGSVYEVRPARW